MGRRWAYEGGMGRGEGGRMKVAWGGEEVDRGKRWEYA